MTPLIEPESAAEAQFLSTIDSCVFPSTSTSAAFSVDRPVTVSCLPLPSHLGIIAREHLESVESLVQVAWALILRQYLGGRTACFGYVANQDNYSSLCGASVTEHISLQRLDGVFAALDPDATLTVTLGNWHRAYTCRRIKSSHLVEIDQALVFNTALVVGNGILVGGRSRFNPTLEFPVVAFIDLSATIPQLAISCQPGAVPPEQQSLLAHAFQSAISAFLLNPKQKVRDLNVFTVWDHQRIATWNGHGLVAVNSCVHSEFSKIARRMGQAPAICSWDGHVSYEELDRLSSVLAATLKAKGIEPESMVALRFSKSLWAVVSMLAILKAGGAFVSLDPSQPDQRQKTIFEDANAALLLMPEVPSTEIPLWATERFYMVSEASTRGSFTQDDHGLAPVIGVESPSSLGDAALVAYVSIGASFPSHPNKTSMTTEVKECISAIAEVSKKALVQVLPSYMIPTVFVPVQHIPLSTSGKTDIRTLRQICSSLSWAELLEMTSGNPRTAHRKGESDFVSKTEAESHMADAWATLLGISPDQIEPSDSFISLGGNSLMAIHLVAIYRERGLSLAVADILQHPELSAMTACTVPIRTATLASPNPATLSDMVTGQVSKEALFADAAQQCGVGSEDIVAVYPCTPLQVEMMDLSLTGKTSQFAHELSRLWPTLDFSRFKNAWEEIVKMHPILRTRFIRSSHDGELKQVIVDEPLWWEAPRDFDDYMATNFPTATTKLGDRLARWSLYEEPVEGTSQATNHMLIISLHHAIFDGVVLHHIFTNLFAIYTGNNLSHSPPNFGEYLWRTSKDLKDNLHDHVLYWGKYLAGWEQAGEFPPTVEPRDRQVHATGGTMRFLPFPGGVRPELGSLTLSTFLRGVWAILLARRTASECVVFSTFLAGRTVDMEGIERLVAPTFTHVPILARLSASQTVREFLAALQADAIAMMPYEATGMPRILQQACQSGSNPQLGGYMSRNLLVVQPMPKGVGRCRRQRRMVSRSRSQERSSAALASTRRPWGRSIPSRC
ncbi:nonribosomal siderophore peptide synthase Sid2 [Apiospora arundinis]